MRVSLLKMNDFQAPPIGTEGTILGVDDIGSVMVAWDNGCGLNVVLDEDRIEILPDEIIIKHAIRSKQYNCIIIMIVTQNIGGYYAKTVSIAYG